MMKASSCFVPRHATMPVMGACLFYHSSIIYHSNYNPSLPPKFALLNIPMPSERVKILQDMDRVFVRVEPPDIEKEDEPSGVEREDQEAELGGVNVEEVSALCEALE